VDTRTPPSIHTGIEKGEPGIATRPLCGEELLVFSKECEGCGW
jgi:hypothetical protein